MKRKVLLFITRWKTSLSRGLFELQTHERFTDAHKRDLNAKKTHRIAPFSYCGASLKASLGKYRYKKQWSKTTLLTKLCTELFWKRSELPVNRNYLRITFHFRSFQTTSDRDVTTENCWRKEVRCLTMDRRTFTGGEEEGYRWKWNVGQ